MEPEYTDIDIEEKEIMRFRDIMDFIEIVDSVPSHIPKRLSQQILMYETGGAVTRLYVYDRKNQAWRYASLT